MKGRRFFSVGVSFVSFFFFGVSVFLFVKWIGF